MTLLLDEHPPFVPPEDVPSTESNSGSRWGRRLLIGCGAFVLVLVVAATAIAAPHFGDGVGDRSYHPTSFAEIDHQYSFGIGSLEVDLRDVDFPPGTHVVRIDHGIGSAHVWLPDDINYDVSGDLDVGEIDLFGQTEDGFDNELVAQTETDDPTTVIIDLEVDIGYGRVRQG